MQTQPGRVALRLATKLRNSQKRLDEALLRMRKAEDDRRCQVMAARDAGLSLAEIGQELGTSRGRVAQLVREHEMKGARNGEEAAG